MKKVLPVFFFILFSIVALAQDSYRLSSESKLTIDGTSTVHDWTVTANTMKGMLRTEGKDPKEINFEVAVEDIISERGATMDKKMHTALQKETHPNVIFSLKEVKNESILVGKLNIAGKELDVEISGKIDVAENMLKISGEYPLALQDFNIEPPTAMFGQVVVGPDVTVKFDLVFTK